MPSVPRQSCQGVQQKKAEKCQWLLNILCAAHFLAGRFVLNVFDVSQVFKALCVPQSAAPSQEKMLADHVQNHFACQPQVLRNQKVGNERSCVLLIMIDFSTECTC